LHSGAKRGQEIYRDPLECAKALVEKGFIWDKSLQNAVQKDPSDDVNEWDSSQFEVVPNANLAVEIDKIITPEIELEIFENRLGVKKIGIEKALLNFYEVIRTSPILKTKPNLFKAIKTA
jgi:hypothetical protein